MRLLAALAALALVAIPAADGKLLGKVIVVGADGRSAEVAPRVLQGTDPPSAPARLDGGFVLVYPLMERDLPARPSRFYLEAGAFCSAWNTAASPVAARCWIASPPARRTLAALRLGRYSTPPPRLLRLSGPARSIKGPDNYTVGIELAFNRSRAARRAARPAECVDVRAVWSAAGRPARFCLAASGAWSSGRLHPYPPGVARVNAYLTGRPQ